MLVVAVVGVHHPAGAIALQDQQVLILMQDIGAQHIALKLQRSGQVRAQQVDA